jgi:hypothetical protein
MRPRVIMLGMLTALPGYRPDFVKHPALCSPNRFLST